MRRCCPAARALVTHRYDNWPAEMTAWQMSSRLVTSEGEADGSTAQASHPVRVVAEHELHPLLLGHRVLGQRGEALEVVLARRAGGEHQQHRGVVRALEPVQPALRHVEEVAGP